MSDNTEQFFNIPLFFHKLEELDSDLQIAESDIRRNEKIKGNANFCISAILRLETALLEMLIFCESIKKKDLDTMLHLHAQTLMQFCQRINGQSLDLLHTRMMQHEKNFEQFFERRYPGKPLPPAEPEGAIYTPEIVDRYKHLLQNKPQEKDWPLVSRKHLRLCLYMLEQTKSALQTLVSGKLPQIDVPVREMNKPLPRELSSPEALKILQKLRENGILDDRFMPAEDLSIRGTAVLAQMISHKLWAENRWKVFQDYWGVNNLSTIFVQAMKSAKTGELLECLGKILK